jgi:hypothetical protein
MLSRPKADRFKIGAVRYPADGSDIGTTFINLLVNANRRRFTRKRAAFAAGTALLAVALAR